MEIAYSGSLNSLKSCKLIQKYLPGGWQARYIGTIKPFTQGYDLIIDFGVHPRNLLYLKTCSGVKVSRFTGSDWHNPKIGKGKLKTLTKVLCKNLLYASIELKEQVGLSGTFLANPVDTSLFYPRTIPRCKDTCYYCPRGKEDVYMLHKAPEGATIIDGTVPHDKMPYIYSQHRKYVRYTKHDANPKMPYEALLCGCEVWVNGVKITEIPDYMLPQTALPKWVQYFEELL